MKHVLILLATLQGLAILVGAQQYGRPCTQTSHGRDCRDNADSETSAASAPVRQCPPGRVYAGEVRDKDGKLTGYHCVKDVSSQPMSFPPQQQGIPIGNAPISIGNASDGGYVSPGSVSPASSTADLLNPSLRKDSMKQKPGCAELIAYRDGQLMHDLGVAIDKKTIYDQGKLAALDQAKDVLDLMNKEWYFGKTGAEIVIHVKLATDEVKAILKMFLPAEGVIDNFLEGLAGRELQKLPQTFAEEYQPIVESTDVRVG